MALSIYPIEAAQKTKMMEWLALFIKKKLESLLSGKNKHTMVSAIGNIGRIEFSVDENAIETVDVLGCATAKD